MGRPQLTVSMNKYFNLQNFVQTFLVHKTEVGHNSVLIWATIGRNGKTLLEKKIYRANQRKAYTIIQT